MTWWQFQKHEKKIKDRCTIPVWEKCDLSVQFVLIFVPRTCMLLPTMSVRFNQTCIITVVHDIVQWTYIKIVTQIARWVNSPTVSNNRYLMFLWNPYLNYCFLTMKFAAKFLWSFLHISNLIQWVNKNTFYHTEGWEYLFYSFIGILEAS